MKYLIALLLSGCAIASGPNSVATVTVDRELDFTAKLVAPDLPASSPRR